MIVRPCTRADFEAFYGRTPPMTVRALAAERDGTVVGVGGYYIAEGVAHAFSDQKGMTKREIVTAGHKLKAFLDTVMAQMVALCGPDGDTALKHYGFRSMGDMYMRVSV